MKGFMAEADTYEEVKEISQQLLGDMIIAKKEREDKAQKKHSIQRRSLFETAYYLYERQSMALSY
jgi:Ni,Fe-hydrogenase III component G